MTALRRALTDESPPFDLGGGLGLGLLCLLISAWLHLVFFIAWQRLDGPAADRFYFNLENESPAIELTLSVNEAPPAEIIPSEEIGGTADETAEALTPEEREALAALEKFIENAQARDGAENPAPPEAPAQAGLNLPAPSEGEAAPPADPDPPLKVEAEAPEFKSYYTAIRRAVNQRWVLPPEAQNQFRPSRLTCDVTIARDGTLLRIVVIESSGNATLDHAGLEALRAAAPFPPFTSDLAPFSQLEIRMQFDYQARYLFK